MPVVPRLQTGIQTRALNVPQVSANAPIEAFGGGESYDRINQASQSLISNVQGMILKEKEAADDYAVQEAYANTVRKKNDLFWNEKSGVMTRKGKDAFGALEEYGGEFTKYADEVEGTLSNEDQKAMYKRIRLSQETDLHAQIQRHTTVEQQRHAEEITETGLIAQREDAILNYQYPGRLSKAIQMQRNLIIDSGQKNGRSQEWIDLKTQEVESRTHTDVIKRMLSLGNDIEASNYFKGVKKSLTGGDTISLEGALEEGTMRGQAQRITDNLVTKYSNDESSAFEATKNLEPKLRDAVEQRLEHNFRRQAALMSRASDEIYTKAANIIDQNPGAIPRDLIDPSDWARIPPEKRKALENRSANPTNDNKAWLDFLDMDGAQLSSMSRSDFESKYWVKFDSAHKAKAENMREKSREGSGGGSSSGYKAIVSDNKQIDIAIREAKIGGIGASDSMNSIKANPIKNKAYVEFYRQVDDRYNAFKEEHKRYPGYEEKKKIIKDLQVSVTIESPEWYKSNYTIQKYNVTDEIRPRVTIPLESIPKEERDKYTNKMFDLAKSNGLLPHNMTRDQALIKLKKQYEKAYGQGKVRKLSSAETLGILREGAK